MAEGARLLIECGVKSFTEGSNPSVSASAPLAQLDRASGYGPEGQEFESLRVRHYMPLHKVRGHASFSTKERERAKAEVEQSETKDRTVRIS